jgi:transposase-like protein
VRVKDLQSKRLKKTQCPNDDCQCSLINNGKDQYSCSACRQSWSYWAGTVFASSHLSAEKKALLLSLLAYRPLTSREACKIHGFNTHPYQRLQRKIFERCYQWMLEEKLIGPVEADETYLGQGLGRSATPGVFLSVEKKTNGRVIVLSENSFTKQNCNKLVKKTVLANNVIITDGWKGYNDLEKLGYTHQTVATFKDLPQVHSAISHLKRYLKTYVRPPKEEYLHLYLAHWAFLYSHRGLPSQKREGKLLELCLQGRILS